MSPRQIEKEKAFFVNYAKDNKFNPLDPSKWYSQSSSKINAAKVKKNNKQSKKNGNIDLLLGSV